MSQLQTTQKIKNTPYAKACPKGQTSKIMPILIRTWAGRPRSRGSILDKEKYYLRHSCLTNLVPNEYQVLYPLGVKRAGRKADHLLQSSTDCQHAWSYPTSPTYAFKVRCLIKLTDKFILTLSDFGNDFLWSLWWCFYRFLRTITILLP